MNRDIEIDGEKYTLQVSAFNSSNSIANSAVQQILMDSNRFLCVPGENPFTFFQLEKPLIEGVSSAIAI